MTAFLSLGCRRHWLWAVFFLCTSGLLVGCNPQALNFLLMPFVDDRVQPKCKLETEGKKEVVVAILTTFTNLETRPEMLPVESELSDRLAAEMRKRTVEAKEKMKFIPTAKVHTLMNQSAGSNTLSPREIGQKLKADFVINLEINSISLYEKGSFNQLFRGKTEIAITCVDVHKPQGEGTMLQEIYPREYPGARGPIDAGNSSVLEFRTQFLNVIAQGLARFFIAYSPDENRRMD